MPSLQAYTSHGRRYYRIVESYRREGKPRIRVLAHLGKVEDLLELVMGSPRLLRLQSKMAGAVTALHRLAVELELAESINQVLESQHGRAGHPGGDHRDRRRPHARCAGRSNDLADATRALCSSRDAR